MMIETLPRIVSLGIPSLLSLYRCVGGMATHFHGQPPFIMIPKRRREGHTQPG
jgi:hypothetical protein